MVASRSFEVEGMSGKMTPDQDEPLERNDDFIAAEYVLGVLSADERQAAHRRIESDRVFARLVEAWELRLSPLGDGYPSVQAPDAVKLAVDQRLFGAQSVSGKNVHRVAFWKNFNFWRGFTIAALASAVLFVAVPRFITPQMPMQSLLVASLAADGSDVKYLVVYDAARRELGLSHVAGDRMANKDFELWMIEGNNKPVSMGVIQRGENIHIRVPPAVQEKLAKGAVLAVSLEQTGGSPTGQPAGPVVAAGDLRSI